MSQIMSTVMNDIKREPEIHCELIPGDWLILLKKKRPNSRRYQNYSLLLSILLQSYIKGDILFRKHRLTYVTA